MQPLTVQEIIHTNLSIDLELLTPQANLDREISVVDLNRPGLALAGFFDQFAHNRIQVFGKGEWAFLNSLEPQQLTIRLQKLFSFEIPFLVFTHNNDPQAELLKVAKQNSVAIFKTKASSHMFNEVFSNFLDFRLSPKSIIHGVLLEIFGIGILLQGKSGIGKSETALELIERGHRLVSDDIVLAACKHENQVDGFATEENEHHMEIRGLGIIDIKELFGTGSVRKKIEIDLVIHLEEWNNQKEYDRLGIDDSFTNLLGVNIPSITLPILPGRNLPILIETAAKNFRLKAMGTNSAKKFVQGLELRIKAKNKTQGNIDV